MLFVGRRRGDPQAGALRALGFFVAERDALSDDAFLLQFPVVLLADAPVASLPAIANRLRAKARFGRRVIAARVSDATPATAIRSLQLCGVDEVLLEQTSARTLGARLIHRLRERPELRCILPATSSQLPASS